MGKLTSFATGMGEGYLAGKRYKDNKARQERQDAIMEKVLAADPTTTAPAAPDVASSTGGKSFIRRAAGFFGIGDDEEDKIPGQANGGIVRGYANGGMIGGKDHNDLAVPYQSDCISWQRQSFKK